MTKSKQLDLEEKIADTYRVQDELPDAFTGEMFKPKSRNHYETNSGIPVAPQVDLPRPTIRQRVENLLNRGYDPMADFMRQAREEDTYDFDVPDDPDAPLTASEASYVESLAAELAEAAPLPDDGMPRPEAPTSEVPKAAATPGGGEPAAPIPPTPKEGTRS